MNDVNIRGYHHGDLPAQLLRAGIELAAEGGPQAIRLRELARRTGVSPAAVYRHFPGRDGLVDAVRCAAADALASSMRESLGRLPAQSTANERIMAAGRGYFTFAMTEPMLFGCLADGLPVDAAQMEAAGEDAAAAPGVRADGARESGAEGAAAPFRMLVELVAQHGVREPGERVDAAITLWAAVHGICALCSSGALRELPEPRKLELLERTLASAARGFSP